MRFATFKTLSLLLSLAALGILFWTAHRGPHVRQMTIGFSDAPGTITFRTPHAASSVTVTYTRSPSGTVTIVRAPRSTGRCVTWSWNGTSLTVSGCR